ncbi:SGNH/GDSL hydrolase family protein [Streptomyces sp. MS2.AVA.5]|uniref:SGNH/GDSL hydrolase family protein n=1 Tax=Streptomyces achmelvichensis TaxID=3134111 RepID=A0ACC6Q8G9_9ACTN
MDNSAIRNRRVRRGFLPGLLAASAVAGLGIALFGGQQVSHAAELNTAAGTRVLWLGDSIAGTEAPALGAALQASGVQFKDSSRNGGGTVVNGGDEITQMLSEGTWERLAEDLKVYKPTVIAYQVTTYDWGSPQQQRSAYEKLVAVAKDAGAKAVFVPSPPVVVEGPHAGHEAEMEKAPQVAEDVAERSGGAALFFDSSQVWGNDPSAPQAQRSPDGFHNCQQGAVSFAGWFTEQLGNREGFTPAPVGTWADGSWTATDIYSIRGC